MRNECKGMEVTSWRNLNTNPEIGIKLPLFVHIVAVWTETRIHIFGTLKWT